MCGFIVSITNSALDQFHIQRALDTMERRGPDAQGIWTEAPVSMGHCRLAIQDLDSRSSQPMHSSCGRYVIAFNGEIYNFPQLRKTLTAEGIGFDTTSDTEVLLKLFAQDGEAMLHRLEGMFAFVIWDRVTRRGFVARDPYGIKPLYMAKVAGGHLIGSQVKALLSTQLVSREADPLGQAGYWMLGSVPEPHTWYRDIEAIPSGSCLWITERGAEPSKRWHDVAQHWRTTGDIDRHGSQGRLAMLTRNALLESVSRHLIADVPVGVFLSGGIDSSAIAALMVQAGARHVEGVTIAFDEFQGTPDDESPLAGLIAKRYGIKHTIRRVTKAEFEADLPRILNAMDQPSIDGINTWYASKAVAEQGLKVVMSGVGGDELFQGYPSFKQLPPLVARWQRLVNVPGANALAKVAAHLQARRTRNNRWRFAPEWTLSMEGAWWMRRSTCAPTDLPQLMGTELATEALKKMTAQSWPAYFCPGTKDMDRTLAVGMLESSMYLRNQLLRDSDWASMDHSVELRTPLVDARLLQTLAPWMSLFGQFPNKTLLAHAPDLALPADVVQRPKTGFSIPIHRWQEQMTSVPGRRQTWAQTVANAYQQNHS